MNQNEVKRRKIQGFANIISLITILIIGGMAKANGVTYLAAALLPFGFLWSLIGGNTADTLGVLLRSRNVKGQYRNAAKMRRSVMIFQMFTGLAGTVILFLGANFIGDKLFSVQYSVFLIMLLSPAVFLRSVSSVLMGFCQGEGSEFPTAVACMLRQVFILVFSMIFCRRLGSYGENVSRLLVQENFAAMYTGAGAAMAVDISEVFVILFLLVVHKIGHRSRKIDSSEGMRSMDSFMGAVRSFTISRAPHFAIRLLILLPAILGLIFFQKSATDWEIGSLEYGAYFGKYLVYNLISILLIAGVFLPMCSRTMICLRKEEQRFARVVFQSGVHITVIHSLYFAVFLSVMSSHAASLIDSGNAQTAEKLLQGGSLMIPCAALSAYFGRFLILTGKKLLILGALLISDVVYGLSLVLFLNVWKAGILALVYSGIMGWAVCCILLGVITYRQLRIGNMWFRIFIVPVGAVCVMGLVCMLLGRLIGPHLGDVVTLIVCGLASAVIYWAILLLTRNFREQELECIPGGRMITILGQTLHIF